MVPWARGYDALQKDPNTILFLVTRTAERNPMFRWVGPLLESNYGFFAKANSTIAIKNLNDARKLGRIGVYNNDVRESFLTQAGFTNLDRAANNIQNVKKLMSGRIDAYASANLSIEDEAKAAGYKASDLKPLYYFMHVQLYLAFSMSTPETVVKGWSDAFASMQKDGNFIAIYRRYYPSLSIPGKAITNF
jgi:polar amino acid transport system substrate-binding protein